MSGFNQKIKSGVLGLALVLPTHGYTAAPDLAQEPLFVGNPVAPNLLFILDDSGSMDWEYMPDGLSSYDGIEASDDDGAYQDGSNAYYPFYFSSRVNKTWYNPNVTYLPPIKADGSGRMPNSSYTSAPMDGYDSNSNTRDLTDEYRTSRYWRIEGGGFYWEFNSSESCESSPYQDSCYTYVSVNDLSDAEKTNFANWFSYYRIRMMAAKAGIGAAFDDLSEDFRVGWGTLNTTNRNVDGASDIDAVQQGVRAYTSAHRTDFYEWLYQQDGSGSTYLKRALQGAGEYYEKSLNAWRDSPGDGNVAGNPARECRPAFTILMTDGYYSGSDDAGDSLKKADDRAGESISNPKGAAYQYSPVHPFKDDVGSDEPTLADVAMYFWKRDLRDDLDNYVPIREGDPAFWQHMVTFGVGLGVAGSVDPTTAFNAVESGSEINWWSGNSQENKINDLLHAGVNSRGGFFSADNPDEFAEQLKGTLDDISADVGSATAVEFDVSSFQEGAQIFSAQFDPNSWTGDLKALKLEGENAPEVPNADKAIEEGNGWSAQAILDARDLSGDPRTIVTYLDTAGKGSGFQWANLEADQIADLSYGGDTDFGQQVLAFIRGDRSKEDGVEIRKRNSRLGSIVNSSPEYVGSPKARWPDNAYFGANGERYSDFKEAKEDRDPVVYVGSNDGMLHGFAAGDQNGGSEVLGYIPNFVYSDSANAGLHYLASPDYRHRYYVDLDTRQQDIYTKGRTTSGTVTSERDWRSILVGGGRAGAKGVFALDITDPADFTEGKAAQLVLWEFTAEDDSRLGYVTQAPVISPAKWADNDVRWTAFVANGYDSTSTSTGFFMLDIEGGLDGVWSNDDYRYVEFESNGDGLSPLTVLDTTGDYLADRVYAGDLDGNIWVAGGLSGGSWGSVYSNGSGAEPLFTTASGQAITVEPKVTSHPTEPRAGNQPNLMIYFGTGKYLESDDVKSTSTQAMYGVWDKGNSGLGRGNLVARSLNESTLTVDEQDYQVRQSTGDDIDYSSDMGWYANLPDTGERIIVSAQTRGEFLFVNSMIPDVDPCKSGGSGWLMAFGLDGKTPDKKAFVDFPQIVAGYKVDGLPNQSTVLGTYRFTPTTDGQTDVMEIPPLSGSVVGAGRRGWQELIQ